MRSFLGHGELMVVETEEDWFLGTVEVQPDSLVVRSGHVGRPVVVPHDEVVRVVLAADVDPEADQASQGCASGP